MKKYIMGIIIVFMLVAISWFVFFYEPDPEPSPAEFGSWGTNLKFVYADGTERYQNSPLSVYDDGQELTSIVYELSGKAIGNNNQINTRFIHLMIDWKIRQGGTTVYSYKDYLGENPDCPNIPPVSDVSFPVDGNWHVLLNYYTLASCPSGQTCGCIIPTTLADGVYTVLLQPIGGITYNPDGEGWEAATLPDPVSFDIEVVGLKVFFKQGDY